MGRQTKRLVAGVLAAMCFITACNSTTNHDTTLPTSTGTPKHTANSGQAQTPPDTRNTTNPSASPQDPQIPDGYTAFDLTSVQLDQVRQALASINVQNVNQMDFYGAKVYVPQWLPKDTELTSVLSGGQAGYPMYVSFTFNTFTLTLLNQSPVFTNMTKSGTTDINGQTATWYTRAGQQNPLSFLEYNADGTYVSFTSSLQGITKQQLEIIAKSLVPLKSG